MHIENLNQEQLETLRTLLNEMAKTPKVKIPINPIDQMIDNIMDEFDFGKVQITMDYLGWKWVGQPVTINMLKDEARRLLRGAAFSRLHEFKDEHWEQGIQNSTGGFQAMAWCDEDKTKITMLDLKFILTGWDCDLEDLNRYNNNN
jgi:hypothetical protein